MKRGCAACGSGRQSGCQAGRRNGRPGGLAGIARGAGSRGWLTGLAHGAGTRGGVSGWLAGLDSPNRPSPTGGAAGTTTISVDDRRRQIGEAVHGPSCQRPAWLAIGLGWGAAGARAGARAGAQRGAGLSRGWVRVGRVPRPLAPAPRATADRSVRSRVASRAAERPIPAPRAEGTCQPRPNGYTPRFTVPRLGRFLFRAAPRRGPSALDGQRLPGRDGWKTQDASPLRWSRSQGNADPRSARGSAGDGHNQHHAFSPP